MEKFNVCLLNDSFPPLIDGVANAVVNYAKVLKEEDLANPFVVTPKYPGYDDSNFEFPIMRYTSLNIGNLVEGYRAGFPFIPKLLSDIIKKEPNIIHTHCPFASTMIARELRSKVFAPIIFTYHTKFDVDIAKSVKSRTIQKNVARFISRNISACDEVWVVSKGAADNLREIGYDGDYVIMNNGVDFPKGKQDEDRVREVSKEFGIDIDVPVLLFVGRMFWYKGIRIIIDALEKLKDEQDFRMVFTGKGADEEEIREYVREHGLDDKVIFTGAVYDREKLRAINTRADLFLFPSTYDTNGLVVREAAACGLASLVIKDSCASEGIIDGVNGYLCDENSWSMYEKLKEILNDMDHLHQVGDTAMDEIYISWTDSVSKAYERYHLLYERKKAGYCYPDKKGITDQMYKMSTRMLLLAQKSIEKYNFKVDD